MRRRRWTWWRHIYTVSRHADDSVCRWLGEEEEKNLELRLCCCTHSNILAVYVCVSVYLCVCTCLSALSIMRVGDMRFAQSARSTVEVLYYIATYSTSLEQRCIYSTDPPATSAFCANGLSAVLRHSKQRQRCSKLRLLSTMRPNCSNSCCQP